MPKVKISEYSATANSNTDVASINIDEGCAPSGINNAIRAIMGHLKDFQSGTSNDPFTVGSSGSLTLSYGTANGVAYLNGAKVLTTGSALTFDGTTFVLNNGSIRANNTIGYYTNLTATGLTNFATSMDFNSVASHIFSINSSEIFRTTSTSLYTASTINVGIGTSSPSNKLTVKPSATSSGTLDVLTGSTNTDSVRISGGGTVNTWLEMRGYLGIKLYSDATNTVTVDASGNLGIGTTTPTSTYSARLASLAAAGTTALALDAPTGTNTSINWYYNGTAKWSTQVLTTGEYRWYDFVAGSTRMTLDASGRLGVGYTAPTAQLVVGGAGAAGWLNGARNTLQLRFNASSANQSNFISFGSANNEQYCFIGNDINADGTTVNQLNVQAGASGGVFLANTGTSWTAVSDERNKDIIEPITDAMAKVATLRSVIGKYKTDEQDKRRTFLIAQDVQAVLPEAITVGSDENSTLGLSYTDTIPLLVAAIKELKAEFDAYKASQP